MIKNYKVYKYTFDLTRACDIQMPVGARILHVDSQAENLCCWALIDADESATETREFFIMGTGHSFHAAESTMKHLGTVLMRGGTLVLHVFELIKMVDEE